MSELDSYLDSVPEISFIDGISIDSVKQEMVQDFKSKYKELTGVEIALSEADPNRLILYACALQIYQSFQYIDRAGKQDMLKYAYGGFLDNLAAIKGVTRNQASYAITTVRFYLSSTMDSVVSIPESTKVTNQTGVYFETMDYAEVPKGELYVDVDARCADIGAIGNNIKEGDLTVLVDLLPYVDHVINITDATGGADVESDESLAERTYIAPSSYSTAGPNDAYKYWCKTFSSEISDINVTSLEPGYVDIVFLVGEDKQNPTETMVEGLKDYLMKSEVRPLTDNVRAYAPEEIEYDIELTYYIPTSKMKSAVKIQSSVNEAIQSYINWQRTIGRDINPDELITRIKQAGAKRVAIVSPTFNVVTDVQVPKNCSCHVTYGGLEDD